MKKLLLSLLFVQLLGMSQIELCEQRGNNLHIKLSNGRYNSIWLERNHVFVGYSSSIIVIRTPFGVDIYDDTNHKIANISLRSGDRVVAVVGDNISIKEEISNNIIRYGKDGRRL